MSDDIEERIEEAALELKGYVDERLEEFKEQLINYLTTNNGKNELRKELMGELIKLIERVKSELLAESRQQQLRIAGKIENLETRLHQLLNKLQQDQTTQQGEVEARLLLVIREVVAEEIRKNEVKKLQEARRRRRMWMLMLIGGVAATAIILAIASSMYPWLLPLIIIIALIWLRR